MDLHWGSPAAGERQLVPKWAPELVVLSYAISWLGAYTSTQIVIHAKYTRRRKSKILWTFLASVAFGFSSIWSMHFVGMIACGLDIAIGLDLTLTILSAIVAVAFTFAAFCGTHIVEVSRHTKLGRTMSRCGKHLRRSLLSLCLARSIIDIEAGYQPVNSEDVHEPVERPSLMGPLLSDGSQSSNESEEYDLRDDQVHSDPRHFPPFSDSPNASRRSAIFQDQESHQQYHMEAGRSSFTTDGGRSSTDSNSGSMFSDTPTTSGTTNTSGTSFSRQFSESLHAGLSRESRMRITAQARNKPPPTFGWKYWLKAHYNTISLSVAFQAGIWALAIVFMHYCGMWAMEIPQGRISWNVPLVALSFIVAYIVCFVGCIAMVHMEVHFGRQMAFSTISSAGVCSMHYTGMAAATFYTKESPSEHPGYPTYLPFAVIAIAMFVCVVTNVVLAHSAIISRNRMAEMILTKRRLWRIMAEKEAAEQANELKQQFISVASHEIRTPLHAVNGYCELLATTRLSEEQNMYVSSIEQACHAINVIAGNVLDFSKLERNNVELSARPVLVDMRKMTENLARLTDSKGVQPGRRDVDVVVSVARDVPSHILIDEVYVVRILMNLLSNAQKFCDKGHICVAISMSTPEKLMIRVSDTGCGIPKSFMGALFQPFRQADTSLTRPRQGTGLGLSIVKHLIQRMSGDVDVDSVEGCGSTFTVQLPIALPPHSGSPSREPLTSRPAQVPGVKKRIKIIYSNECTARLFAELWTQFGYAASVVAGGARELEAQASWEDVARDADAIWADVESVRTLPAVWSLLTCTRSAASPLAPPILYIVHSDARELEVLEPALSDARGVVLVKRPVMMHVVVEMLETAVAASEIVAGVGGRALPPKVRFALPEEAESPLSVDVRPLVPILPALIPPPPPPPPPPPTTSTMMTTTITAGRKGPILLVEDNVVNQHLGKRLLEKIGYDVITAGDGQSAIDLVMTTRFSCCLMDCQMPVLDGFAATSKIRELESDGTIHGRLPIIALTANVSRESEEKCRAAGMDHFLPKPFRLNELKTMLAQYEHPSGGPA